MGAGAALVLSVFDAVSLDPVSAVFVWSFVWSFDEVEPSALDLPLDA